MKIKYIDFGKLNQLNYLILETSVTIRFFYETYPKFFVNKGILIVCADLDYNKLLNTLHEQLDKKNIENNLHKHGIWIDPFNVHRVFSETDFGYSQDCCFFLESMPSQIPDFQIRLKKGKLKNMIPHNLENFVLSNFSSTDIFISYENIPDLLLISKGDIIIQRMKLKLNI